MRVVTHAIAALLLSLGLSSSLMACSSFTPEEPPVADSTFIQVFTELHLAAARVQAYEDTSLTALHDSIFAHYGVSRTRFEQALKYYSKHPSAYVSIYNTMQDSLDAERMSSRGHP